MALLATSHPANSAAEPSAAGRTLVLGVGGAGCNFVRYLASHELPNTQLACADTDVESLKHFGAGLHIRLGQRGLGAGAEARIGHMAAKSSAALIRAALAGVQTLCIVAGLGGGTGGGASPVVARIAREAGVATFGLVLLPFEFEGPRRTQIAKTSLRNLADCVGQLAVLHNDDALTLGDDITQSKAFDWLNERNLRLLVWAAQQTHARQGFVSRRSTQEAEAGQI